MKQRNRILAYSGFCSLAFVAAACTAILTPRDDVQRCGTSDDCDSTGDERYVAECRFDPDNADLDTTEVDKVCVAAFKKPTCDPTEITFDDGVNVYQEALDEFGMAARYTGCDENPGTRGCEPAAGTSTCEDGLSVNDDGLCDDPDARYPAKRVADGVAEAGQDIYDQFCRSFFCDRDFVCDRSDNTCVKCDPDKPYGEGGCGEIYIAGELSCIYLTGDDLDDACQAPDSDLADPAFGGC